MSLSEDSHHVTDHSLSQRKTAHIEICTQPGFELENGQTGFDQIHFRHRALPETDYKAIELSGHFLNRPIRLPIIISSMTGGSDAGYRLNKELALAAQVARIPLGMGSIRVLFRHPEVFSHFQLRKLAPDVPIWANLGVQELLTEEKHDRFQTLLEWTKRLEVDALAIHLNPGQELFQDGGTRDFRGLKAVLKRFLASFPLPVLVKETGFGIAPDEVRELWKAGAAWVDISGAGGTNWLSVEAYRAPAWQQAAGKSFGDWGWPTALATLAVAQRRVRPLIASGGIRSGVDVAKALALGAQLAGLALPLIRAAQNEGSDGVLAVIEGLEMGLRTSMLLAGASSFSGLRKVPLDFSAEFEHSLLRLRRPWRRF